MIRRLLQKVMQNLTDEAHDIELGKHYRRVTRHVLLFMLGGMITYLPSSIACLWEYSNHGQFPFVFKILMSFFCPLQGSCNFLIYTFAGLVREKAKRESRCLRVSVSVKKPKVESSSDTISELSAGLLPTPTNSVKAMGIARVSSQSDFHTTDSKFSWSYYHYI